ncbi:uncharacterized protein LOC117530048 [Thalassophryne amazonica]|uniref:uncharacterized protein LOC117530048 n=1 Tax=Thalassophryne amazonica TaxID=390379 RepID=UPI00147190AF|nr:uncharacterized protein LOC117530048 [Thalassophryne amazonica]
MQAVSYVPAIFAFSSAKVPKSTATAVFTPLPPPGRPSSVKQCTTPLVPPGLHDYLKTTEEPNDLEKIAEAEKLMPGVLASMRELEQLREQKFNAESHILSVKTIEKDPCVCMFWTGFPNHLMFMAVFSWLSYKASTMTYWMGTQMAEKTPRRNGRNVEWCLTLQEEFFLTMVRLKTGFVLRDLAQRFGVSESSVRSIFTTWINLMYFELREWFQLPDPNKSQASDFPNARVIIDCAELFCETPGHFKEKKHSYSDDKHYETFKFLVALSAHPAVFHVSNVFGGHACDVHDVLAASRAVGGKVMADRFHRHVQNDAFRHRAYHVSLQRNRKMPTD